VVKVVVLDSSPLGLLVAPRRIPLAAACQTWVAGLLAAGHRVFRPEIADYEIRRELLRLRAGQRVVRLDGFRSRFEYAPITTPVMDRAAELWAHARHTGQPTAPDERIDIDMILVAQAEVLGLPNTVIATANTNHIPRFHPAELWSAITT
jgi:predicted nucleic acid-binding protein